MPDVIDIHDLGFGYTRKALFRGLDLVLQPGNIYGLLGKNGAGKTTLLKLICGLRYPQTGACRVLGLDPRSRPVHLLQQVFCLTEEFLLPPLLPDGYARLYGPFYPGFDREVFQSSMTEFEIDPAKKLSSLSYGQKKKFLLSFGMATRCKVLLLDEPTNGLDIPSKGQLRRLLARTVTEDQVILISTHQVRDMENVIDPVIVLDEGRIIFQQPMDEVTRRLSVQLEADEPRGDELFSDKTLGGWVTVRPNKGGEETRVDLETLFSAVIANRKKVADLFRTGGEASNPGEARNG